MNDVAGENPLQRIRALQAVSQNAGMLRFTLADWVPFHAHLQPVWFTPTAAITATESRPDVHDGLVGPFAAPDDAATTEAAADLLRRLRGSRRAARLDEEDPLAT